jgi:plasmid stabilization system protein ParE
MAKRVTWAPKALADLYACFDYILADHPPNADRVRHRILKRVMLLSEMTTGRSGRVFGTFEAYVPKTSMIICYEVPDKDTLHILRLIHAKRDWPSGDWPTE